MAFHEILTEQHSDDCTYSFNEPSDVENPGPRITIISGPSGCGKGTIVRELSEVTDEENMVVSRSYTDRAQRPGEPDDAYHFVSREEFEEMIAEGAFIEWAEFIDHYKGSPSAVGLLRNSDRVLFEIDIDGATQLRDAYPESRIMFILPESREQLESRLLGRGDQTEEEMRSRITKADEEFRVVQGLENIFLTINRDGQAPFVAAQLGGLSCGVWLQSPDEADAAAKKLNELVENSTTAESRQ